ncbi:hypothetical protein [Nostoc sp. 'Peltigera membranacea cyanobiont' 210A]|nr:hypothetical protein [Nostoc sp. 'Peltigera membranacea cyanobiont' 210A]
MLKYLNIAIAPSEAKCNCPLKPLAVSFPVSDERMTTGTSVLPMPTGLS